MDISVTIVPGCRRPFVYTGWAISLLCTNSLGYCSSLSSKASGSHTFRFECRFTGQET